jgi:succinate dehydrogenase / fumarate reductase cytochrome b subunit
MGLLSYLKSTILSKWVMAITGVVLVGFIFGHALGNMQLFIGKEAYNTYAAFLQGLGEGLWIMRIVLALCLVLHVITSIRLKLLNNSAKPKAYQYKAFLRAKITSRTMIWTGLMIFAFLTYHILHFTAGMVNPDQYNQHEVVVKEKSSIAIDVKGQPVPPQFKTVEAGGKTFVNQEDAKTALERHDVYKMVVLGFKDPIQSAIYIIGVVLLGFHLSHAIQSMFQTMGFNHPKYSPMIEKASVALAVVIVLCMISLPVSILTGIVGGNV